MTIISIVLKKKELNTNVKKSLIVFKLLVLLENINFNLTPDISSTFTNRSMS